MRNDQATGAALSQHKSGSSIRRVRFVTLPGLRCLPALAMRLAECGSGARLTRSSAFGNIRPQLARRRDEVLELRPGLLQYVHGQPAIRVDPELPIGESRNKFSSFAVSFARCIMLEAKGASRDLRAPPWLKPYIRASGIKNRARGPLQYQQTGAFRSRPVILRGRCSS